jgi:hypothetical protein
VLYVTLRAGCSEWHARTTEDDRMTTQSVYSIQHEHIVAALRYLNEQFRPRIYTKLVMKINK